MPVKARPKERRSKFQKLDDVSDPISLRLLRGARMTLDLQISSGPDFIS